MKTLLLALLATAYVAAAFDCTGKPDGVYEWGCKAYTVCRNQTAQIIECKGDKVFNQITKACDDANKAPAPCGIWRNCTKMANGRYPDLNRKCEYFYTCQDERFLEHNPCPTGLVFNAELEICDWPYNVAPPCGSKQSNHAMNVPDVEDVVMYLDCTGKPDDVYEWNCESYTKCEKQRPVYVKCSNGMVYNKNIKQCGSPDKAPSPCGVWRNCTGVPNKWYADMDRRCKFYYDCSNGEFLGHYACPPGLIFDEINQVCDWLFKVPPPCGIKRTNEKSLLGFIKRRKLTS